MAVGPDGGVHVIHWSRYYASDFGGYGDFDVFYSTWVVAELRLWDRALTRDELVAKLYTALPSDAPGLVAYYRFRNTARDFSGNGNDGLLMYRETYVEQDFIAELTDATDLMTIIQLLLTE